MKNLSALPPKRNRQQRRHNITLDGSQMGYDPQQTQFTSPKNRNPLKILNETANQRIPRHNSIQNLIQTCKNGSKKHVTFDPSSLQENPKSTQFNLFTQIREMKHIPTMPPHVQFKIPQSTNTRSNSQVIDYKLQHAKQIQRFETDVETDSELLLSCGEISKEEKKNIMSEVGKMKERAVESLKGKIENTHGQLPQSFFEQFRKEIGREVDQLIEKTLEERKQALYEMAQLEVKAYFKKIESRKKRSPGSSKTQEGTPCFDDRKQYSFSRSNRRTIQRNTAERKDGAKITPFLEMSMEKVEKPENISTKTAEQCIQSNSPSEIPLKSTDRQCEQPLKPHKHSEIRSPEAPTSTFRETELQTRSKQHEPALFTIGSRRKSEKTTKKIKDSIISGKRDSAIQHQITVKQFNV